jgi:hypothetical protein
MATTANLTNSFDELVQAYEDADDDAKASLIQKIKDSGKSLRVVIVDELIWEESQVEGFDECPMVIQSITVFLGEETVYEVERWFGSEMVDSTHTGLDDQWQTIRVDDGSHDGLIELLEDFDHPVDEPDVPEWR